MTIIADLSKQQQDAILEIEKLFQVSEEKLGILMQGVGHEMRTGLKSNKEDNDLKMIPSFVTGNIKKTFIRIFFSRN
jgi:hexokinase